MKRSLLLAVPLVCGLTAAASAQTNSLFGNSGALSNTSSNRGATGTTGRSGGGGGQGGPAVNTQAGTGGVNTSFGSGFVGRSDSSGRFVGSQFSGQQRVQSGNQFRGTRGQQFQGNKTGARAVLRPRARIAFRYTKPNVERVQSRLVARFEKIASDRAIFRGLVVTTDDEGTVTLRGTVEDSESARLVANVVRLEPGVRGVRNELKVAGTAPATPAPGQ